MSPMLFDLIIIALVLLSIILGFVRGFCKELFTIFGWVAAIIATIYFAPVSFHIGERYIDNPFFARLATSSVIFLVTLGVCSLISYFATRTIHASKLGIVDKSFGLVFGIIRAVVLLGLAYLLFLFTFSRPESRPDFIQQARTRPFLEASAHWIKAVIPAAGDIAIGNETNALDKIMKPENEEETPLLQTESDLLIQDTKDAEND